MQSLQQLLTPLKAAAKHQNTSQTRQLHACIVKIGFENFLPLLNSLLNAYSKCSSLQDALQLFNEITPRDPFTWSSLLSLLTHSNLSQEAVTLFSTSFSLDNIQPDGHVFASLLNSCANLSAAKQGKQIHAQFITSQFPYDDVVKSALVDMYSKCRFPDDAGKVFDTIRIKNSISLTAMVYGYSLNGRHSKAIQIFEEMPVKSLLSWTALISGFVQNGDGVNALKLFKKMRCESIHIEDPFVVCSVVGASATLASLALGMQLHCLVILIGYESSIYVSNALVDMYAKCSDIFASKQVFDDINRRDVVSWTAMIVGAAQHGWAEVALGLFEEMVMEGLTPNEVTFVGLIYACSHKGLVDKGRQLFSSMVNDYGLKPSLQHYTCLLDLLSRSGLLQEAKHLIMDMPFNPDEATWGALLSACKREGDTWMGIQIANHLLSLNPQEPSTYILLSNTYASAQMWDHVAKVRKLMSYMAVSKVPGYSRVELGMESYMFCAGELIHPMRDEIIGLLGELMGKMKGRGYVPDTNSVLHDLEQQEKQEQLFLHSERLAVALGLLKASPGTTIRVVKNLRVCGDCHTVLKLISDIVGREIIVRDANRFHHFKDGMCSCGDFW
ncbi:pentatricopeptide repeat-containing protein At4g14050, mitochondrial [Aristolochia californica]|uniref:pentatricopeptide repeat-containing protein At4g14050, mitochondrial n=1 Tax=Aristolochia californica TaxID=171875 RepID=UPI0035D540F9